MVLLSFHTLSLIAFAVTVLNVLFWGLNALLQGLAYKLGVYSCIDFANFLKSRMRCDKAGRPVTGSHWLISLDHCTPITFCPKFFTLGRSGNRVAYMTSFVCSYIWHPKKWSAPGLLLLAVFRVGPKNKNLLMKRWRQIVVGEVWDSYVDIPLYMKSTSFVHCMSGCGQLACGYEICSDQWSIGSVGSSMVKTLANSCPMTALPPTILKRNIVNSEMV